MAKGVQQKELAYLAEMNPSNLSKLERGDYTWTKANLNRIATALHVSLEALFASDKPSDVLSKESEKAEELRSLGAIHAKLDLILSYLKVE